MRLCPLGTSAIDLRSLSAPDDDDDDGYVEVDGMTNGKGNRGTRSKRTPVLLSPPQIPRDLTWDRSRAAELGSRLLTAWVVAQLWPK
jgi:hypothetical protein